MLLLRYRVHLVQTRTSFKNKVHQILDRSDIELSGVISDIFGLSGLTILDGLLMGKSIDRHLQGHKEQADPGEAQGDRAEVKGEA